MNMYFFLYILSASPPLNKINEFHALTWCLKFHCVATFHELHVVYLLVCLQGGLTLPYLNKHTLVRDAVLMIIYVQVSIIYFHVCLYVWARQDKSAVVIWSGKRFIPFQHIFFHQIYVCFYLFGIWDSHHVFMYAKLITGLRYILSMSRDRILHKIYFLCDLLFTFGSIRQLATCLLWIPFQVS